MSRGTAIPFTTAGRAPILSYQRFTPGNAVRSTRCHSWRATQGEVAISAIVFVFVPIFYPVVAALGIDLVWFGALVAVTLQTAFLSPPVAMSGYYLKQVVPAWPLSTIFKGMMQFMGIQLLAVGLLLAFPAIATWLPDRLNRPEPALDIFDIEPYPDDTGTYQA